MPWIEDKTDRFVLHAPHTPLYEAIVKQIGGRSTPKGYKLPRMMSVYDDLHALIPGLNELPFPCARGFGLVDMGQDQHPKWDMLRTYQRETIDLLVSSPQPGTLVNLSPGLGKSPVSVVAADVMGCKNVLIVSILSLRRNWLREIEQWTGREAHLRYHQEPVDGWNVTNYDTLTHYYNLAHPKEKKDKKTGKVIPTPPAIPNPYARKRWDLIIVDESVLIKNRKATRTKAIKEIRRKAQRVWLLSGSPTTRHADDMWSQLNVINPAAFSSYWRFTDTYCVIDKTVWGTNIIGTKPNVDFVWSLRDVMISYNQKDVLDLPPLLHEKIDLDMTPEQVRVYNDLLHEFIAELESGTVITTPNRISRLTRLVQVVSSLANIDGGDHSAKADAVQELIESEHVEYPLLIWVHWLPGAGKLYERLTNPSFRKRTGITVGVATGAGTANEDTIDAYKKGDISTLILSLGVGKYGHTLTNTRSAIYVDRTFDGDAYYQSLHRLDRFGLGHSPQVITLRHPGTVESFVVEENLAAKMATVSQVTEADLAKLMRSLGKM